ncbi:MAG: 1-acyl-sn-glycerol-3-phosphate acyltransferase [Deltaproteobacteria bacterium]|nr:MAG: 1-acyl-sn-glycerol-3-phosphate acyltransferase [Deltaproteobacteria bacterium]
MGRKIVAGFFFAIVGFSSIIFFIGALVLRISTQWFDPKLRILHLYTCFWGSSYIWMMKCWKSSVKGRENIERDKTYVVVSNHQSQLDILLVFTSFFHFKWVSKIEVFNLPLIGWNMRLNKYIKLKRGDKKSIAEMMVDARKTLKSGSSVFIFAEGTRSETGILRPFKPGAFILAKELGLPILPVVINGTGNALPKYSINYRRVHNINIEILEPIPFEKINNMEVEEAGAYVRDIIAERVEAHQAGGYTFMK